MSDVLGAFEQAVLLAVVRLGNDAYGRAVHAAVQERLDRTLSPGAVHATLDRLEHKACSPRDWVKVQWRAMGVRAATTLSRRRASRR